MIFVNEDIADFLTETSVGKHTDLVSYVTPSSRSLQFLEVLPEQSPHISDSLGNNVSQFRFPLLKVSLIAEDLRSDFSSVSAGTRVHLSDNGSS